MSKAAFHLTFEGRESISQIQRKFEAELNEKQIWHATAQAINDTSNRVQGFIRKQVRNNYTVNSKYLARMSFIRRRAKPEFSRLYSMIDFNYRPVPMIGFKHSGYKGSRQPISMEMKRGRAEVFRHAFIATMRNQDKGGEFSEHEGIYAAGRYEGKKFVYANERTPSGKMRITELKSASAYTMAGAKESVPKINIYVDNYLPGRLKYFLQKKLEKLTK
jgi:vacuolar-type H+-ATPase subunit E/Vma4